MTISFPDEVCAVTCRVAESEPESES